MRLEHFSQRWSIGVDLAPITRITRVKVRQATHADGMMVPSSVKRCSGGRAHSCCMEAGVTQSTLSEPIDVGRVDLGAVTTKVCEAHIVEHHDEHIGRASWWLSG